MCSEWEVVQLILPKLIMVVDLAVVDHLQWMNGCAFIHLLSVNGLHCAFFPFSPPSICISPFILNYRCLMVVCCSLQWMHTMQVHDCQPLVRQQIPILWMLVEPMEIGTCDE